MITSFINETAY